MQPVSCLCEESCSRIGCSLMLKGPWRKHVSADLDMLAKGKHCEGGARPAGGWASVGGVM